MRGTSDKIFNLHLIELFMKWRCASEGNQYTKDCEEQEEVYRYKLKENSGG